MNYKIIATGLIAAGIGMYVGRMTTSTPEPVIRNAFEDSCKVLYVEQDRSRMIYEQMKDGTYMRSPDEGPMLRLMDIHDRMQRTSAALDAKLAELKKRSDEVRKLAKPHEERLSGQ